MLLKIEERLKKLRISKNEFARRLGKPHHAVRPFFQEGYDPRLSTLVSWCKVLDCRLEDLVTKPNTKAKSRIKK